MISSKQIMILHLLVTFLLPCFCFGQVITDIDKTEYEISKVKKFTLTTTGDIKAKLEVEIELKYQSKNDTYTLKIIEDGKDDIGQITFNSEIAYYSLKTGLNNIFAQKDMGAAISESSLIAVYEWVYLSNPRNLYDRTTLSGSLDINDQIMVIRSDKQALYRNYEERTRKVKNVVAEYEIKQVEIQKKRNDIKRTLERQAKSNHEIKKQSYLYDPPGTRVDKNAAITNVEAAIQAEMSNLETEIRKTNPDNDQLEEYILNIERLKSIKAGIETDGSSLSTGLQKYIDSLSRNLPADKTWTATMAQQEVFGNGISALVQPYINDLKALQNELRITQKKLNDNKIYSIKRVSLQFERGFLERVMVWVDLDDKEEIFENIYAIGFSSTRNYRDINTAVLFARYTSGSYPYIYLGDVIANYNNKLYNFTRDYSPADTTIDSIIPAEHKPILVNTERLVNIFDSKVYTDLRGIAEDQPNGMLQIDINKRINLKTSRFMAIQRTDWGYLNYVQLWGVLSKIEADNRYLPLHNDRIVRNGSIASRSYASNLDLRLYEIISFGTDINLFLFDYPDNKFTFYLDLSLRYGLTKAVDTVLSVNANGIATTSLKSDGTTPELTEPIEAHTLSWSPKLTIEVFPQNRVGFSGTYQYFRTALFNNNRFDRVASYVLAGTTGFRDPNAAGSHMLELFVRVNTSEKNNNKFFARARFFWQQGEANTSFSQLQIGYSYNLFYKK